MKNLYLKDLLLEIPTQVTNTIGSLTAIKGLLIQVRTLRQTSYIFRSCWRTAWSGKVFFYFGCVCPCCCLWTCRSHHPAFPKLSQISALKPFLSSSFISSPRIIPLSGYSFMVYSVSLYFLYLYFWAYSIYTTTQLLILHLWNLPLNISQVKFGMLSLEIVWNLLNKKKIPFKK